MAGKRDWIALCDDEDGINSHRKWNYVTDAVRQDKVEFTSPLKYGLFCVKYFRDKEVVSRSMTFSVGPNIQLSAVFNETDHTQSRHILVTVDPFNPVDISTSWIGMYKEKATPKQFHKFQSLSGTSKLTLRFPVPKSGVWEFRLFPDSGYTKAAQCSVSVPGKNSLSLVHNGEKSFVDYDIQTLDPANDNVWIGIFFEDYTDRNRYRRYTKIASASGKFEFKTPIHPGSYIACLYSGTDFVLKSNSIPGGI